MKALLVTTPKNRAAESAREARKCVKNGKGFYFRRFTTKPRFLKPGIRIYYVEDGHIRGFSTVTWVEVSNGKKCSTTGKRWPAGVYACMIAPSWRWIRPIPYKGFQGYRYFDDALTEVVGDWLDPMPKVAKR